MGTHLAQEKNLHLGTKKSDALPRKLSVAVSHVSDVGFWWEDAHRDHSRHWALWTGETMLVIQLSVPLRPHGLQSARFLCPWDSPGKNTGMGRHFLLQGVFPTQGSNIALQEDSLPSGPPGKPHRDWGKLRAK